MIRLIISLGFILTLNFYSIGQKNGMAVINKNYKILPEEYPSNIEQIKKIESISGLKLPDDYKDFLLQYNGGVVYPNYPQYENSTIGTSIERFFSVGDIQMICSLKRSDMRDAIIEEYKNELLDLNPEKFIFIALCERGNLLIYCGEDDYGRICYANFSGGNGVEKTKYTSIYPLLDNLTDWDEEYPVDLSKISKENFRSRKIFELTPYFYERNGYDSTQAIQRFKEVLDFYGDPNLVDEHHEKDVVQFYINYPPVLKYLHSIGAKFPNKLKHVSNLESLKFLLSLGIESKGLLNTTRDLEIIKYLVEECAHNLNEPFEEIYPLLEYTKLSNGYTNFSRNRQYEIIRDIINLGYDLDLSIVDKKGQSVKDRLEILEAHHRKFIAKNKR